MREEAGDATDAGEDATRRRVYRVLAGAMAVAMLAVTLFPVAEGVPASGGTTAQTEPLPCLVCGEFGAADLLLNAAFFAPLGVLVALAAGRRRGLAAALLAGFALSAVVEAGQLLLPGRFTTLGDLVTNTVGAGLGGLASAARTPAPERASRAPDAARTLRRR